MSPANHLLQMSVWRYTETNIINMPLFPRIDFLYLYLLVNQLDRLLFY